MCKRKESVKPNAGLSHRIELITEVEYKVYFRKVCDTARFAWKRALAKWHKQFYAGQRPNCFKQLATVKTVLPVASLAVMRGAEASSPDSAGEVTRVTYDTVCKKDQGRKKIVHFCALLELQRNEKSTN